MQQCAWTKLRYSTSFPRLNNCFVAGDPASKVLSEFREHRVRPSLTFFLSSRTFGTRLPFSLQERGKGPV